MTRMQAHYHARTTWHSIVRHCQSSARGFAYPKCLNRVESIWSRKLGLSVFALMSEVQSAKLKAAAHHCSSALELGDSSDSLEEEGQATMVAPEGPARRTTDDGACTLIRLQSAAAVI